MNECLTKTTPHSQYGIPFPQDQLKRGSEEIILTKFAITIKVHHIRTIWAGQWLDDEVRLSISMLLPIPHCFLLNHYHYTARYCPQIISFYLSLIVERHENTYAFSTFFLPKLMNSYEGVKRWTKKVSRNNIHFCTSQKLKKNS